MRALAAIRSLACAATASVVAAATAGAQAPGARRDTFPAVTLPNTQLRHLRSAETGREYDIYVSLPADYSRSPGARYPVLYVLDAQWDFKLMLSVQGGLVYDRFTPPIIVVGVTWAGADAKYDSLRAIDLTPQPTRSMPGSGDAPRFLAFLRTELIPLVESSYRADPARRVLMGSSLGGLFTLYALFTDPRLFAAYIAGSPAVTYAGRVAFAEEAAYAAARQDLPVRLYIAVGSLEDLARPVQEFWDVVRARRYSGLVLETRVIEGERHSGNKPEAFNRGLRFALGSP